MAPVDQRIVEIKAYLLKADGLNLTLYLILQTERVHMALILHLNFLKKHVLRL